MPKITSHTPRWLDRPSPAYQLFQEGANTKAPLALSKTNGQGRKIEHNAPCRTTAHRGTEVFVVVGNEIRWSDLVLLRDNAVERTHGHTATAPPTNADADTDNTFYRILKTPVAGQIRQLLVSPLGDYLAILTSHTVHIAVLPDSSHLSSQDKAPLRIKTFQLGPTAHVLEQAPVASAVWHPLGHLGACLVTVTTDACVRLWELNRDARHSFDEPALALDLKKLANASSSEDDFRASKYGTSKAFSPDSVEMEVAAACFGGLGSSDEHGWSPMTLWVAMTEGDVYALCPLLPSKWEPSLTTIPSLTTSVVAKTDMIEYDADISDQVRRTTTQQRNWLADIDSQQPFIAPHPNTLDTFEVYDRPAHPPAIPKLQGPFQLTPEPDYSDITDILVIAPRVDDEALMQEEEDVEPIDPAGLSVGVICLATKSGDVHVCLDLNGVEAQWLPTRRARFQSQLGSENSDSELVLVESIKQSSGTAESAQFLPSFTRDPTNRYAFFLNLDEALVHCSLSPWINDLEDELMEPSGAAFRLENSFAVQRTALERIMEWSSDGLASTMSGQKAPPQACISLVDSDLGWLVLTAIGHRPQAVVLDLPIETDLYRTFAPDDAPLALPASAIRQPYQPSGTFTSPSTLPKFLDSITQSVNSRLRKTDLKSQVRFSPATLQLLTEAHRVLSSETSRLGAAAADLFRRCERMKLELTEQIRKVEDIARRIDSVTGDDDDVAGSPANNGQVARIVGPEKIEQRMDAARTNSDKLHRRVEALRYKIAGLGGKELSAREEAWREEVLTLRQTLGIKDESGKEQGGSVNDDDGEDVSDASLIARLQNVTQLQKELLDKAKEATEKKTVPEEKEEDLQSSQLSMSTSSSRVPPDFRKQKVQQVMQLLERETALVDAVTERLGRLRGLGA